MISLFFNEAKSLEKSSPRDEKFLRRHALFGQYFRINQNEEDKVHWKKQVTQNLIVREELESLSVELKGRDLPVCLLKGFALMGDIYQDWGERFASDVDVLVSLENLWRFKDTLIQKGYVEVKEKKWKGNCFKFLFKKRTHGIPITIEVHTQLFWHTEIDWQGNLAPSEISGFFRLSKEVQLLHLCGHYGFQHTFIKLFWLVDIHRYLKKYESQIHWASFWNLAARHSLYRSCYGIMSILDRLSRIDGKRGDISQLPLEIGDEVSHKMWPSLTNYKDTAPVLHPWTRDWIGHLATNRFLSHPRRYPLRYLILKNFLKDSFYWNRIYWVDWVRSKLNNRKLTKSKSMVSHG